MGDNMFQLKKRAIRIGFSMLVLAPGFAGCTAEKATLPVASIAPQSEVKPVAAVEASVNPADAIVAAVTPAAATEKSNGEREERTAFYRADSAKPATMPKVQLSKREQALCRVKVGDAMPEIELPKLDGGEKVKLASLLGKKATVVVFWKGDRRMAREQLADLPVDVIEPFGKEGVEVVGIAVNEAEAGANDALTKAEAKFTNLLDADGKAFEKVGSERLPRTYVLDPKGNIVWFDIEYSLTTRRELHDVLRLMTESEN
jgi:peroxiredoxin